jgi:hypothetical protein
MRRLTLAFAVIVSTLSLSAGAPQAQSLRAEPLASPAGPRSEAPQLTVSDRGILMSWIERGDNNQAALKFAERTATGWSAVRTVASGTDWFVNWADVPSVLRLADGSIAGHWLQKSGPSTYAYDVRLSRSTDDGKTWSPSVAPHHDGTQTEHGFASMFQVPGGGLGLIWLDGRETKAAGGAGGGHDGHGTGAMTIRYGAFDRQFKQVAEAPVDLKVCECCPTSAAVTSDGLIAAFRNRTDDEIRDIYVSRFENGKWTEPRAVHNDNWQIAACPVNGPMLSARGRDVAIAWFSGAADADRAFVAFSRDAGRTFGAPVRVDDVATLGRVDVELMPDGSAMATWIELVEKKAEFKVRRIQPDGTRGAAIKVADMATSRSSGYPRLARHGNEMVFAWTEVVTATPGARPTTQVRTATVR